MNIPRLRFKSFKGNFVTYKIKNIANVVGGGTPSTDNSDYWGGNINWYSPNEIGDNPFIYNSNKKITELGLKNSSAKLHPIDTVLFTSRAGIGKMTIIKKPAATNQGFQSLELKNNIDPYFIYSMKNKLKHKAILLASGSTFLEISKKSMESIKISMPIYSEQQKIGSFFSNLDKQIKLQSDKLEALKCTKKGYLQKMFPSDGSNNPKLRFKGFNNDWKKEKIGNIINVSSSKRVHMNEWTNKGIPFWRARDLVSYEKGYEISDSIYINEKTYEEYSKISGVPKENDLLVTGVGTIGFSYLVNSSKPFYFKDGNIIWFHNDNKFNGSFLKYTFNAAYIQNQIKGFAGVGTVATYTIQSGKETIIKYPEHKEQTLIGMFFNNLDKQIELQQNKLTYLKNQKNAYLQKMFV